MPAYRRPTATAIVPVIVLTRLRVDRSEQGRGLGSALVRDALLRVASIADRVGVRALLIKDLRAAIAGRDNLTTNNG